MCILASWWQIFMTVPLDNIVKVVSPYKIYHFGNRKHGARDIDLLIISDYFLGMSILKRREHLRNIYYKIDSVCLTLQEYKFFKQSRSSLYKEIKANGQLIYEV